MLTTERSSDGTTETISGTYSVAYDGKHGLFAMKGGSVSSKDGSNSWLWVIQSINEKKIYTINETAKTCSVSPLPVLPVVCIPELASYVYSNTSKYNGKEIMTDTWLVESQGSVTYITVTRDKLCIPVGGSVSVPDTGLSSSQTYTQFEAKIKDKTIIKVPKECSGVN
ncbi:unnamed protein product [Adineta steineri]|uniref:Uncharacterized protein n=2 Tax=Adineta steineri TaxID=433720 RepID=A0A813T4Q9_9BILA|nr:unnamed protein product [Adineta steineri]